MAKNLKINIKNLQLASAFKIKKPAQKKDASAAEKKDASVEEESPKKRKTRIIADPNIKKEEEPKVETPPPLEEEPVVKEASSDPVPIEEKKKEEPPKTTEKKKEEVKKEIKKPIKASLPTAAKPAPKPDSAKDFKAKKKEAPRTFDGRDRQGLRDIDNEAWRKKRSFKPKKRFTPQEEIIRPKTLSIRLPITVKDLAHEMKLKASQLISKLFMQGMTLTLNDYLDDETIVQLIGHEFSCAIQIDTSEQERIRITEHSIQEEIAASDSKELTARPPVIAFMGHVDHGKTSLIDAIRKSNRAAGEAGAITQHIGAFKVKTDTTEITVLDTPGHEAFSEMRSRGANVTDMVILVVAGDEGMRAQTDEALSQAKEAGVPLLIAINKCDKENFDEQKIYRELSDRDLLPEAWGGSTITVNCSAVTGQGIKELLEMISLQAEILELKANPNTRARGTILESQMHKGLGAVATLLVQNGTLAKGDAFVFGPCSGRIKTLQDDQGKSLETAGPSTPVKITGLSELAIAGNELIVVKDEKEAKKLASARAADGAQRESLSGAKLSSLEKMMAKKESGEIKILPLILRADVQGSLEAVKNSLLKIQSEKVRVEIVSEGVGEISESDIELAAASKSTIVGFHTSIESKAEELIKVKNVPVYTQDVIYHLIDEIKLRMKSLLDKLEKPVDTGSAYVKAVFKSSHLGNIAGCQVSEGTISRQNFVRQLRAGEIIWTGKIASLKRDKEDVKEVQKGFECGILLEGRNDILEEDVFQAYEITYLEQEL